MTDPNRALMVAWVTSPSERTLEQWRAIAQVRTRAQVRSLLHRYPLGFTIDDICGPLPEPSPRFIVTGETARQLSEMAEMTGDAPNEVLARLINVAHAHIKNNA